MADRKLDIELKLTELDTNNGTQWHADAELVRCEPFYPSSGPIVRGEAVSRSEHAAIQGALAALAVNFEHAK